MTAIALFLPPLGFLIVAKWMWSRDRPLLALVCIGLGILSLTTGGLWSLPFAAM